MQHKQVLLTKGYHPRSSRIFSKELKRKLVEEIEKKRLSPRDVVNLYKIAPQTVYRWLKEFSSTNISGSKMVVESESHEHKTQKLLDRITELERAVGKKQMEIDFLNKAIEICSDELGYDAKKKCTTILSNGTG